MIEADLQALMRDTVFVAHRTGTDAQGQETHGAAVAYAARVVRKPKLVRTKDGEERVSMATVYLASDYGIGPDDRLTLPDGTTSLILSVGGFPDEFGAYAQVVHC